eukprot:13520730-Alexandrium_andersonii.AAC.1
MGNRLAGHRLELRGLVGHQRVKVLAYVARHRHRTGATVRQDPARADATVPGCNGVEQPQHEVFVPVGRRRWWNGTTEQGSCHLLASGLQGNRGLGRRRR